MLTGISLLLLSAMRAHANKMVPSSRSAAQCAEFLDVLQRIIPLSPSAAPKYSRLQRIPVNPNRNLSYVAGQNRQILNAPIGPRVPAIYNRTSVLADSPFRIPPLDDPPYVWKYETPYEWPYVEPYKQPYVPPYVPDPNAQPPA
jgi:hypothetical protein